MLAYPRLPGRNRLMQDRPTRSLMISFEEFVSGLAPGDSAFAPRVPWVKNPPHNPYFVPPSLDVEVEGPADAPIVLVSAPGAVGKTTFAEAVSHEQRAPLFNLAKRRVGTDAFWGSSRTHLVMTSSRKSTNGSRPESSSWCLTHSTRPESVLDLRTLRASWGIRRPLRAPEVPPVDSPLSPRRHCRPDIHSPSNPRGASCAIQDRSLR